MCRKFCILRCFYHSTVIVFYTGHKILRLKRDALPWEEISKVIKLMRILVWKINLINFRYLQSFEGLDFCRRPQVSLQRRPMFSLTYSDSPLERWDGTNISKVNFLVCQKCDLKYFHSFEGSDFSTGRTSIF